MLSQQAAAASKTTSRSNRAWCSLASAAVACTALVVPSAGQVTASAGDTAVSSSRFLAGSLLVDSIDLDTIAVLAGTNSSNSGSPTPDTDTATLDLTALQTANVDIPGGISLGLFPSFLQVGAVNHYSQASDEGISRAASGAVSNAGAVDTTGSGSFPSDAQISLTPLLTGPAFSGVISQLDLAAGAITGVAALDARQGSPATTCADLSGPTHCLDYNVAEMTVDLVSPAVAEVVGLLTGSTGFAATVDAELAASVGSSGTLAQALADLTGVPDLVGNAGVDITITSDVTAALDTVIDAGLTDGVVDINLRTGAVTADLDALLQSGTVAANGINDLDPNTEIISTEVLIALAGRIDALLATVPALAQSAVISELNAATLHVAVNFCLLLCTTSIVIAVDGTIAEVLAGTATASITVVDGGLPVSISVSALLAAQAGPLNAGLFDGATGVVPSSTATLTAALTAKRALVGTAINSLSSVVSLVANVQEVGSTPGSHREVALRLTVGDLVGAGGLATVDLGRAEVGRNTVLPTSVSMTPVRGPVAGGMSVTITGTDFVTGETTVNVDGVSVSAAVASATLLTFVTPAHVEGTVPVSVTTPGGTTAPLDYTYIPVPTETSMIPVRGPVAGGTSVTITGSGFVVGETTVNVDGVSVPAVVASATELTFVTPAHVEETVPVSVTTPGGTSTANLTFTYDPVPTETSMTPVRGPVAGGTSVTITGSGFVGGETTVNVDGVSVSAVVASATELTFVTPAHVAAAVPVSVTTPGGSSTANLTYTYDPVPTETSMTPVRGPVAGGTSVTITGSGFVAGETSVTVDAISVPAAVASATELTFVTPAHVAATVPVSVTTPGGSSTANLTYTYDPVPTETSMTPVRGPVAGGTSVTITGSGFVAGETTVVIGGASVVPSVASATELTFVTPAHVAATVPVSVTTPGGASAPLDYTYVPVPTETSMIPVRGPVAGGTSVTITGSGFVGGETSVNVDGVSVSAAVVSATELTFVTPAHVVATVPVSVTTPGGTSSPALTFTYDPLPISTSLSVDRGPLAGGTTVTITGSGFIVGETTVSIGGTSVVPSAVTATELTFVTPPHDQDDVEVTVTTPGGTSNPLTFFYDPIPTGSSLAPARGPIGGGTTVTVTGTGFVDGETMVEFGSTPVTPVVSGSTELTFVTPPNGGPGDVAVIVTTPGGSSNPLTFWFDPVPTESSLSPGRGPISGGMTVSITGTGFIVGETSVVIGSTSVPAAVTNPTSLTFVTPAVNAAGTVPVSVTTPGGSSSAALTYIYDPVPTESSLSPIRGPISGGTSVTVTGTGFIPGETSVTIDPNSPTPIAVAPTAVSSTSLTFLTPAHAAGPVEVAVTTPGGTSAPLPYTYDPVPTESSLSPDHGPISGGTVVTIEGAGFVAGATTVTIDASSASPTSTAATVSSPTSLTFITPAHALGAVDVTVTTPGGTSAPLTYTYDLAPNAASLNPARGPLTGGTTVTITGSGFEIGQTSLTFDGDQIPASEVVVTSNTSLTFEAPPHDVGEVAVTVTTTGGTSSPALTYTYDPVPTETSLTPDRGPDSGGTTVTVTGTGFVDDETTVRIGGIDLTPTVLSPTSLRFVTPAHSAERVNVTVTTPGGTSAPLAYTYDPVPTESSMTPVRGPVEGGTVVSITGTGFVVGETKVIIDQITVGPAGVAVASATSLTFTTPAHALGPVDVAVITPGGTSNPLVYTYEIAPTIDHMTPPRGPLDGGTTVTMVGTSFIQGDTSITIDGSPIAATVLSPTQLTFINPAHDAGPVGIAVSTAGGISAPATWIYDPQPTTAPLSPARDVIAGGARIAVGGTGFVDGFTTISVDGVGVPLEVLSSTAATFVAPAHDAAVVDVVVTTTGGNALAQSFTYLPVPEMAGLDVTAGPATGGTRVTIEGEGFLVNESSVMIGDSVIGPASVEVEAEGTSLTFTTTAQQSGVALVTVETPGGVASPALDFTFVAPVPVVPVGGLPETGLGTTGLLVPAGLLLVVGGLFLAMSNGRRRDRTNSAS